MSIISTFFAFIFGISIIIFLELKNTILILTINSLLNLLRSIPELIWALILLVAFGLGPFTGTIALFLHTSGILGKLFIDIYNNIPRDNKISLYVSGNNQIRILLYQTLPIIFPQLLSYTLYRWENNIRAASILGVVGAGGLGQLLYFNLSLFQYEKVATIIIVIFIMILFVDNLSFYIRKKLT
ncbi:ABC transporter permease subunit [Rickettsiales bacterium]|nr:ABC transporter permease subunit [Rickettsiales bacterium]